MKPDTSILFVALLPPESVRQAVAELFDNIPRMQWTAPGRIHLTLRFIGSQPVQDQEKIAGALANVRVKTFFLNVEDVGGFPERGDPRVLWAGVGRGHPLLHQLRQQVDDALLAAAVAFELRPFVPHITLGRCGDAPAAMIKQWQKQHADFEGPIWPVSSFALMSSEPSARGTRVHRMLQEYPLIP